MSTQGGELARGADADRRAAGLSVQAAGPRHHLTNLPLWRRTHVAAYCLQEGNARRELPFAMQARRDSQHRMAASREAPVARKRSVQFFTRQQGTVFCMYITLQIREEGPRSLKGIRPAV
jgi:hypothetical protein